MKRWIILAGIASGLLTGPAGQAPAAKRVVIDQAAIIVNQKMLTRQEVTAVLGAQEKEIRERFKGEDMESRLKALREKTLEQLIENLLLETQAEVLKIKVTDKEITKRVQAIAKSDPRVTSLYSDRTLREFVVKDLLKKRVLKREVDSKIIVRENEIQVECRSTVKDSREVDVGHILLRGDSEKVLTGIRNIRSELEAGVDFESMALARSEDPSAVRNKGRLGYVTRGNFFKPFEDMAFSMKMGQLSQPVKTKVGYHLIKVFGERTKGEGDCGKMDDITRRKMRNRVYNRKRAESLSKYFVKLRKKADIEILVKL